MSRKSQEPVEEAKANVGLTQVDAPSESGLGNKFNVKLYIRLAVVVLVVVWIGKTVRDAGDGFSATEFSVSDLNFRFVMLAGFSYLIGLVCFGLFWHLALLAMSQRPTIMESLGSYTLSHLGKYVPGKALVVIIRSDRVSSARVDRSIAVVAVFIETLGMMAVGGILASLLLLMGYGRTHESGWLTCLAVGLAVVSGVGASPPMFRFVLRYLSERRGLSKFSKAIDGLSWKFLAQGWVLAALGWMFFGASMVFVIMAFPLPESGPILDIEAYAQVFAAVSLSMVAGFISLLPGGAGVREMVISTLLAPLIGPVFAVISAISLRVVWLLCEVGAAAGFIAQNAWAKRIQ
jgi:glycosyltransferase 2 family protein